MRVLSTDTVPSYEAFAYWRDVLAQHFVHLRPERVGLGPFRSTIEAQQLEGYSFSRVSAAPQRVHRAIREIARSPYDLVFLNLHLRGEGSFRQEGDELVLNPGDLFILDAVRPFELGCEGGVTQISLKVPRQILWERMRHPEGARGTRIPGTSHIGKLLSGYIKTLWRRGETEQKTGTPRQRITCSRSWPMKSIGVMVMPPCLEGPCGRGFTLVPSRISVKRTECRNSHPVASLTPSAPHCARFRISSPNVKTRSADTSRTGE